MTPKKILRGVLIALVAGLVLFSAGRAVVVGATFSPEKDDRKKASRQARSLGNPDAADPRTSVPEGALIGGNGIVEPDGREIRLGSPLPGLVKEILVKEGDWAEEGQPLIRLNDDVEVAALRAAQADIEAARAQLGRTKGALRFEDRRATYAEAAAAQSRAELARQSADRAEKLFKQGAATQDERDKAVWSAKTDKAASDAAEERARAARAGARKDDVVVSEQGILQAEARLAQAKATAERLLIRAPRAGRILQVLVRPGEYFSPGATSWLLTLGDTRKLHVRMDVDERDFAKLAPGSAGFVTAEAFPGKSFPGRVVDVGRRMGRKNVRTDEPTERLDTKILEVLLALDGGQQLVPGLRVMAYVRTDQGKNAVVAPASAPAPAAAPAPGK